MKGKEEAKRMPYGLTLPPPNQSPPETNQFFSGPEASKKVESGVIVTPKKQVKKLSSDDNIFSDD